MQAVIPIPELAALVSEQQVTELLMRPVAGVPLLIRTVLTAARAGASDVLLVVPGAMSARLLQKLLETISRQEVRVELIQISEFDPQRRSSWIVLKRHLKDEFLWLPWNWITTKNVVSQLPLGHIEGGGRGTTAYATLQEVDREGASSALPPKSAGGVAVTSPDSAVAAERFLVANSGKVLDGI